MDKVALIVGAGDATGGAIARRFAKGGYTVCATRRSLDKLQPLLQRIEAEGGKAGATASLRGVFGAPTFFAAGQMYWGQDRFDFVRQALGAHA